MDNLVENADQITLISLLQQNSAGDLILKAEKRKACSVSEHGPDDSSRLKKSNAFLYLIATVLHYPNFKDVIFT